MRIGSYIFFFFLSSIKFLFAPTPAVGVLGYWEAIVVCTAGAWAGICFFYFGAGYFFKLSHRRRHKKEEQARAKGTYVPHKKFTRFNRFVIKVKHRLGIIGFCIITPAIISIPIGCVLMARFYPNTKVTLPLLFAFAAGWAFLLATFGAAIFKAVGWM